MRVTNRPLKKQILTVLLEICKKLAGQYSQENSFQLDFPNLSKHFVQDCRNESFCKL